MAIYADKALVYEGETEKSLGYVHLPVDPTHEAHSFTISVRGADTSDSDAFKGIVEVAEETGQAQRKEEKPSSRYAFGIIEAEFKEAL